MSSNPAPGQRRAQLRRRSNGVSLFVQSLLSHSGSAARPGSHEASERPSRAGISDDREWGTSDAGAPWAIFTAAMFVLAFAARLLPMVLGGGLGGIGGYDDGVYYTAAASLIHGRMPYNDFLLLHPPGILLVLAPFAWLGSHTSDAAGFAAARVAFMLIGALNTALVVRVLRRFGLPAAAVGGVFYAMFFPAIYAERSTLLEPLGTLALLVALVLMGRGRDVPSRWRFYAAGAALGAGVAVKIWYVVAVLVIVAALRGAARWPVLAGAAVAAGAICLPFFVAAPTHMFRYVITDQLGRPGAHVSMVKRVESIVGLGAVAPDGGSSVLALTAVMVSAAFAVCVLIAFTAPDARVFIWLLAANTVVLLASPSYFKHYSTFTAAPLALIVGVAVGRVVPTMLRFTFGRPLLGGAAMIAVLGLGAPGVLHLEGTHFPAGPMRPGAARVHGCVTADDPAALVELNVLTSDLNRGCALWPDVTGWTYDTAEVRTPSGKEESRHKNTVWQHLVLGYLQSGSATILARPETGLSEASRAQIAAGPVLAHAGDYTLRGVRATAHG
jgi:alpha-1,2-mannosyltransferase